MTKEEILSYLKVHHLRSSEKSFKKWFPKEYSEILTFVFPKNFSFLQKLYHYLYNDFEIKLGTCPVCGNRCEFLGVLTGYRKHCCTRCSTMDPVVIEKYRKTCKLPVGITNVFQLDEIKKIIEKTKTERYGDPHYTNREKAWNTCFKNNGVWNPQQSKIIQEKTKNTNIKKRGVPYPAMCPSVVEKGKATCFKNNGVYSPMQSKEIREKSKKTKTERYGDPYYTNREKAWDTCFKNNGVYYPQQSKEINAKSVKSYKKSCLKKYGVDHAMKSDIVKNNAKKTNIGRYGVPWTCMLPKSHMGHGRDSKPNLDFASRLDALSVPYEREFALSEYVYDFKVGNILVEINPSVTHNVTLDVFGGKPKQPDYHLLKSKSAWSAGYECVHVWDWDDKDRIVRYLSNCVKSGTVIASGDCHINPVSGDVANGFVYGNSLFPVGCGEVHFGLFHGVDLVQVVSLSVSDDIRITALCGNQEYDAGFGYCILLGYISDIYARKRIVMDVDLSKCSGLCYDGLFSGSVVSDPVACLHDLGCSGVGSCMVSVFDCGVRKFVYK